jgi:hypothetical protein
MIAQYAALRPWAWARKPEDLPFEEAGAFPVVVETATRILAKVGVNTALDIAGSGVIPELIELVGDPSRVVSVADFTAPQHGAQLSLVAQKNPELALAEAVRLYKEQPDLLEVARAEVSLQVIAGIVSCTSEMIGLPAKTTHKKRAGDGRMALQGSFSRYIGLCSFDFRDTAVFLSPLWSPQQEGLGRDSRSALGLDHHGIALLLDHGGHGPFRPES